MLPEAIRAAHDAAVAAGAETYRDPATGFVVMTAPTLARRGACYQFAGLHAP